MNYDNDSDELRVSEIRFDGLQQRAASTMESIGNRLALAEAALEALEEESFDAVPSVECLEKLENWERTRGTLFVYSDGFEHVIAYGRASLDEYFEDYGYDADHMEWARCASNEVIDIHCDEDGDPCAVDAGTVIRKTASEWVVQAKERAYKVPCLLSVLEA